MTRLEKLNLTTSQRQDSINYEIGNVVEFHRRAAGGFKSGDQWKVVGHERCSAIVVEKMGHEKILFLSHAGKFNVSRQNPFPWRLAIRSG
jgi:hypothetical protein